jgi:two-component system, cell cycle response regulator CpdR
MQRAVKLLTDFESVLGKFESGHRPPGAKLDGWEVGRTARKIDPTIPVIYMSDTHGDEWPSKSVPNSLLLAKPFAPARMVTAISQLLNAIPTAPPHE